MSQFVKPFAKLRTAALCPDTSRGVLTGQANARFAPARPCFRRAWSTHPYARYKMLPALALRRYAIPLKNIRLRKNPSKNIPCNCNKLRPFVFAARGARFWLPRQHTPHYFLHRFADRGARCLPVPLISETRHTHWENNTTALVQVENAKKSTCPAKHTNGILARPCHARRQSAPTHTLAALHTTPCPVARRLFNGRKIKARGENFPQINNPHKRKRLRTVATRSLGALDNTRRTTFCVALPTAQDSGTEKSLPQIKTCKRPTLQDIILNIKSEHCVAY